ncbi:hypothetical protein [Bifidobacterium choerinum]|uniref:Uncharacterized protein n=1 Tax=Bifidobacterium choerinum TaxID=35760 RepID=A0A087AF66_9BIFI|nr:hypothetical protein [Bifidobacterium choerinum]KFI57416.1 hypothetical protein BCHO_0835 [Bifidobacterium choerinum]
MVAPSIDLNVWPELRPQLDAESLVMELFEQGFAQPPEGSVGEEFRTRTKLETRGAGEPNDSTSVLSVSDGLPKVLVFNEIDVDVDAYVQATDVVVFHVEPPEFASRNHQGAFWDVSMSVLVESVDADRAFRLASYVRQLVMCWPFMGDTDAGRVVQIRTPPAFAKAAGGKQATSKRVKQYSTASVCEFVARDNAS